MTSFGSADLCQKANTFWLLWSIVSSQCGSEEMQVPKRKHLLQHYLANSSNILMPTLLCSPWHIGFKYLHYNLQSRLSLKNGKRLKVSSKSKPWKNMVPESLPVIQKKKNQTTIKIGKKKVFSAVTLCHAGATLFTLRRKPKEHPFGRKLNLKDFIHNLLQNENVI